MKQHFLSVLAVGFFLFIAFGSDDTKSDSKSKADDAKNVKEEFPVKKEDKILSFEEQTAIAKDLLSKISEIEKPASEAVNSCKIAVEEFAYKRASADEVIHFINDAKGKCETAMSNYSNLKVPSGFNEDTTKLFKEGIESLQLAYSQKSIAYDALDKYFRTYDNEDLNFFKSEMGEAESNIFHGVGCIGKLYVYFNLIDSLKTSENK